ncbi:MAG TPA: hypothetical protein VE685_13080 [Thermoanaerobaculia bacterium]|nr:hypothetical protein [Thermoanaerobaculia bacterium]
MKFSPFKVFLGLLYTVALVAILHLAWTGRFYYATPLIDRPRHEDFWALKPGGSQGHLYGVIGSSLMVIMLVYSLRKRVRILRRLGKLRDWLDFHIFCGIVGPLLVVLHSSFKVQGLVALSFWSMIAVALSGVLGRYLYLQIPRTRAGDELDLAEVEELRGELTRKLREEFHLPETTLAELDRIALGGISPEARLTVLLFHLPLQAVSLRMRLHSYRRRLQRELAGPSRRLLREITRLARQKALLERRLVLWSRLQQLFHYWHVFHKPFAVVMYVFMVVHIAVALLTGYGWSSSGP